MIEETKRNTKRQAQMPFDEIEWEEDGPPSPEDEKRPSPDAQASRCPEGGPDIEPAAEEPLPAEEDAKLAPGPSLKERAMERLRILSAEKPEVPPDLPMDEIPGGPGAKKPAEAAAKPAPESSEIPQGEETIGEILLAAREREGRSLEFMSEETKIPKQMLQFLETDNFEAIPAKVYVRGFLKTYASALGLEVQHILSKYEVLTGQTHKTKGDHWEVETEVVEEKLSSPPWLRRVIVPAVIVVILAIVLIRIGMKHGERITPQQQSGDLTEEALQKKSEPQAAPQAAPASTAPAPAAVTAAETQSSATEPMELRLSTGPTDSARVDLTTFSVVDQTPERTTFSFMLAPGSSRSFQATEEFVVNRVTNAGGVVFELDGEKLPPLGRKGKIVTDYRITRNDLPKDKRKR
jgi:cytoskeleton protein RodZ